MLKPRPGESAKPRAGSDAANTNVVRYGRGETGGLLIFDLLHGGRAKSDESAQRSMSQGHTDRDTRTGTHLRDTARLQSTTFIQQS